MSDPRSSFVLPVSLWKTFWSPSFWLPGNVTWEDLQSNDVIQYPNFYFVSLSPIAFSFVVTLVRYFVERCIFKPFGLWRGLKEKPVRAPENVILEEAYQSHKASFSVNHIRGLAKQTDMTESQVQHWIRKRQAWDRPTALVKLMESGWRFTYYSSMVVYGFYVLWDKPWFWDIKQCWINYPHQSVTWDIELYYLIELSCYWSMLISQFIDVKRKDFLEMFIHHVATIFLMVFSWTTNFVRSGSLVLIIHDCADVFMEAAKISKYARWQRLCDICFALFFIVWCVSRLVILPTILINSAWFEAKNYFPMFPAYYLMNALLLILFCLHIVWTYFILKILHRAVIAGKTEKDSRSSSEESDSENPDHPDTPSSK